MVVIYLLGAGTLSNERMSGTSVRNSETLSRTSLFSVGMVRIVGSRNLFDVYREY